MRFQMTTALTRASHSRFANHFSPPFVIPALAPAPPPSSPLTPHSSFPWPPLCFLADTPKPRTTMLFNGYSKEDFCDEMFAEDGSVRSHYQRTMERFQRLDGVE